VALLLGLLLPPIIAALTAPPFTSAPLAQAQNRMLGPRFPALVDSNGDGRPSEGGDEGIVPAVQGNNLVLNSRWNCNAGDNDNVFALNTDASGKVISTSRLNGSRSQSARFTSFAGGAPTGGDFTETIDGRVRATGNASLFDQNGDGAFEGGSGGGTGTNGPVNVSLNFAYADVTGDNAPDYITIPWSQASAVGVQFGDSCGGADPQVFVPLADTNGDGRPDAIVADLNGDGVADQQFFQSPRLVPAPVVPTAGTTALAILMALLGAAGIWSLRQRPASVYPQ
jgi:hypothetical protein